MDFRFNPSNPDRRPAFLSTEGIIVNMEPVRIGSRRAEGCMTFVSVEDMDGNLVNFTVTSATYVYDFVTLREGMQCTFYYRADAPVPLIYPPQYNAAVVVPEMRNTIFVNVGYFNGMLVNEEGSLQLNMSGRVNVLTTNNQRFLGNPANHFLVAAYETSTRSIPAQTTPVKVVVLCEQ